MKLNVNISITHDNSASSLSEHKFLISQKSKIPEEDIKGIYLLKKSIDARQREILIHYTYEVFINEPFIINKYNFNYKNVSDKDRVIIIGAGPAGLFAALRLIELGMKPVVIERGKSVENRKLDISSITRKRFIDENSNYCFGEGGAGTYSDGKLYTRSTKKGDVNRILNIFREHGASENILVDSHPHIGTDKLPSIIAAIRNTIINNGGEIHYDKCVMDIIINNQQASGVITKCGNKYEGKAVILATGHSARDIYEMLLRKKILIEAKPFAVGVRVEHPQQLIDNIQYHNNIKIKNLPASSYNLACQSGNKG
ncbi:MAG: FAD-dependent oxidoreductase, partial [Bacteroidetes bacterium]|nr:FAD-dependent oxidoreductase [Bacteroidota bacterium]